VGFRQSIVCGVGSKTFMALGTVMLRVTEMNVTGPARNQIANVVQYPGNDVVASTAMVTTGTGVMFVVSAAQNNFGLRQILWTGNTFRGVRQIFSGARHGKVLLDLLFLAWNLQLLPCFVMTIFH
jgi:hypothetical protein